MDVSIRAGLSVLSVCAALAGRSSVVDPTIGQGPITLSANAEKAFADYQSKQIPRYFAVSTDGQAYYYSYCDAGRCLRQVCLGSHASIQTERSGMLGSLMQNQRPSAAARESCACGRCTRRAASP